MSLFENAHPALAAALTKRGYETLTPVQDKVLDPDLAGQDLLVSAQTGSGKTVAFGLACASTLLGGADKFEKKTRPLALVIAPTRELALQVQRELEWLYAESGASVASCVGGMDIRTERRALEKGAHIVVGTPGRLRDHIERSYFDTGALKAVVLDEADEMLDMGFREELEYILGTAPEERRTLLFSATVSKSIASLAKKYQNDAQRITTKEEKKQHIDIEYQAVRIAPNDRENAVVNILRYHEAQNAIIFCATRAAVNLMTSRLTNRGFSVVAISGELSQSERSNALQALRDGRANVCVATDVAARGIDLPGLALVVHADLPKNRDILLHRSGRTGRAGCKGVSVLVVPHNQRNKAMRLLGNAKIEADWSKPPSIEDITKRDHERFLSSPALVDPVKDDEKETVADLINAYGAEQIAAALIRVHNKQKPAPEELLDFTESESRSKKTQHDDFGDSTWVSLSVGRSDNAEPRWILPMLCGAGQMNKKHIGAIRIRDKKTYVELTSDSADKLFKLVGEGATLEKNIVVERSEEPSEGPRERIDRSNRPNRRSDKRQGGNKKPYNDKKRHGDKSADDRKFSGDKRKNTKPKAEKDWNARPDGDEPRKKKKKKPSGDKPSAKPFKRDGTPLGGKKKKTFKSKKKD